MTLYALGGVSPQVHPDTWFAPDANLIGKVVMEEGSSVWFGATLRGDNEEIRVGAGSNIQEGCVLHTDIGHPLTVGSNCTIGHRVILHGCTIGDTTLIGMGATVLNGARIGNFCLIGAGALVTEGREIPDGSVVMGAPGRVVKDLDDKARRMLIASAENYQEKMRRYRDQLQAV